MWALILLFGVLLPILILGAASSFLWAAIILLRRRTVEFRISFSSIVFAYLAFMMLIGLFVMASGIGTFGKVALTQVTTDDLGYNPKTVYGGFNGPNTMRPLTPAEISDDKQEDVIIGASLSIVGLLMLAPHAAAYLTLRKRRAHGGEPVSRGYNLLALAASTIGCIAAAGTTLAITLQRAADDDAGWQGHAIAEPLAFTVVLLPLAGWFGYRLWEAVVAEDAVEPRAALPA